MEVAFDYQILPHYLDSGQLCIFCVFLKLQMGQSFISFSTNRSALLEVSTAPQQQRRLVTCVKLLVVMMRLSLLLTKQIKGFTTFFIVLINYFMNQSYNKDFLNLKEIKEKWEELSEIYTHFDSSMHSYYLQLISMLKLESATNIYEVGCGRGLLLPYTMTVKNKEAPYLAVDICEAMVALARQNLRDFLSTLPGHVDEQAYAQKNRLSIECCDGQKAVQPAGPFDRVICNLVLMITEDPEEMLRTFHKQAKEGCLLGVTVTGDTSTANFLLELPRKIKQRLGIDLKKPITNHVIGNRLEQLGDKTGWQLLVTWEQKVPEAFFELDQALKAVLTKWEKFSSGVLDQLLLEINDIVKRKQIMCFSGRMAIFRKK